jgi:glycosyltransferase involved in cell wall biosynthesis
MLRWKSAGRMLEWLSRRAYRAADRVLVLSPGYKQALVARGIAAERVDVVYNWCDERSAAAGTDAAPPSILDAGAFNVVYAGNLGRLQGVGTILDAAARLASAQPNVRFVLVGDGVEAEVLRLRVEKEQLRNVRMVGRMPVREINAVLKWADLLLVHLGRHPLTRIGIPQKIQAYLAAGRPVLVAAEGDAADLLDRSGGGMTCSPNDPVSMAGAIERFVQMSRDMRDRFGRRGQEFYRSEMSFQRGVDRIEGVFRALL